MRAAIDLSLLIWIPNGKGASMKEKGQNVTAATAAAALLIVIVGLNFFRGEFETWEQSRGGTFDSHGSGSSSILLRRTGSA